MRKRRPRRRHPGADPGRGPAECRWSLDFVHDQFANGRRFQILPVGETEDPAAIADLDLIERHVERVQLPRPAITLAWTALRRRKRYRSGALRKTGDEARRNALLTAIVMTRGWVEMRLMRLIFKSAVSNGRSNEYLQG